ncbi:uncharacterized protein N7515_006589 [Penicillium bovifimosum]|uniref:Uncharacterized protein n=1 Tax=Penicillium bovifimosum TaxID=126998 RepID=A0A9W9L188_9EURO|nr:uncharacterized protein N7515_006589 [Penicillium bovifimosum]KAJ5130550.1 hypothetical protein N7515_006589 [Penicillium bovifimosum]
MGDKRKGAMPGPSFKRRRVSYAEEEDGDRSPMPQERPNNDPFFGQQSAFPGLDDGGDELLYGDPEDGLEYLRMVRSEANSLPGLFHGPVQAVHLPEDVSSTPLEPESHESSDSPTPGVFFVDEAYVAPRDDLNTHKAGPSSAKPNVYPDTQASYYNILHHRFLLLRSTLRCSPPVEAINALDHDHPISLPRNAVAAHKAWRRLLVTVDPQMVQLACMDMASVLEVLEILARMVSDVIRSEDVQLVRRIGAWAWGLLGKCLEVGQLSSQEVGIIRNVGKRAATILQKVQEIESKVPSWVVAKWSVTEQEKKDTSAQAQPESTSQDEKETMQEAPEAMEAHYSSMSGASSEQSKLEAARTRLRARLRGDADTVETPANSDPDEGHDTVETPANSDPDEGHEDTRELIKHIHVLLDMIITVVGEFFGQRDLLERREVWL